jgi:crotonobetainyl-CoA:carnitine CoA-transferase CaiB-like acyl-CoA transferase
MPGAAASLHYSGPVVGFALPQYGDPAGGDDPPLLGVRVLDLATGDGEAVTRLFADLGADVLKIEPPDGSPARGVLPSVAGTAIPFALHNANKRVATLNGCEGDDRHRFLDLVAAADIVVDDGIPGQAASFGAPAQELARRFQHLVILTVTDFGTSGPYASWRATEPVLYAMSTALSRSGPPTGRPVLPPEGIASATAAVQAAWCALAAYYHRLRCGTGDYIDFSRFEAVVQALDPPFGSIGQGALAQRQSDTWRGRPRNQDVYPIFACKDGYVRTCVMSPRQWRGMRAWLGEPDQFQDPKYDTIGGRFSATREIGALVADLFADQTMDELVATGQRHGVPIAAVLTPTEVLSSDHFRHVDAVAEMEVGNGARVAAPTGPFVVDAGHAGLRPPAPQVGTTAWLGPATSPTATGNSGGRPFDGIRILDLGVIVAGGELGRLFADLGAEVIKVENAAYPDGLRQTRAGRPMSEAFAWAHRNKYGLGLDLRHPEGAGIFGRLVAQSDMILANFKPGTLAGLGFSYRELRKINPRIVLAESSAFGDTGPWSDRMGYGPLVRAATGITRLWTSGKAGELGPPFWDAVTVFPDHVVARIVAIAALAVLIRRHRTGRGAHVHISQAEAAVNQLAALYVTEESRAAGLPVADGTAMHGVYRCAGDDEWCVISVRDDADWAAVAAAMGRKGLSRAGCDTSAEITAWTETLDRAAVTGCLQLAGVSAGPMNRPAELLTDPQLEHRKFFTAMAHPLFDAPLPSETGPAPYRNIPPAELRPAPMPGEHTREVCQKILGLDTAEIDRLISDGALFASPRTTLRSSG